MATRASDARAAVDRSFEQLYRGHHADVFRAALRELGNVHDAEDVTQAAFVDAYRAVLRGSQPQAPRAWLLAIAENVRRRRYRTSLRRPREEPIDADFPLSAELPHELASTLAEALAELPDEQRRVFVLRELGGLSYDEIAQEVGSTVGAIQMLLFRARRTLRELLEPPTVERRRRAGLLVPLPGWLAGLVSRADVAVLTPRAAGAVGASVLAIAGATLAVEELGNGGAPAPAVAARPAPVSVSRPERPPIARRPARLASVPVAAPRPSAAARRPKPAPAPVAAPAPASSPLPAAAVPVPAETPKPQPKPKQPAVAAAVPDAVETVQRVLERPRLSVTSVTETVEELLEPPVQPLPAALVPEAATGAAGAAGAGAPPPPVPGVPPVALPPAP
jgi:RNA polymerase sigma-70 factor (ECF subfamily)